MLRRLPCTLALTFVVAGLAAPAAAFNPSGRSKKPKSEQKGPKPGTAAKPVRDKAVQANTQTFPWNDGNRQSSNTAAS